MMHALPLEGAFSIDLPKFDDNRGSFTKVFHTKWLEELNLPFKLAESYYSLSTKNVLRGMHFQTPPYDHEKIVFCSHGTALDVIVDIRKTSPTFGQYFSIELNHVNPMAIYIPKGFAHGFLSMTNNCCIHYLVSTVHAPNNDEGILYDSFGMQWGIHKEAIIISERDKQFPPISAFQNPF